MPNKQSIHNKRELKEKRQELRKNLTPAEASLWSQIKGRKLMGRRFTKQHSIGNYIVDFYCASEKLIIELDGELHMNYTSEEYDRARENYLEGLGYKIIRFENKMVFDHLPSVLKDIEDNFEQ